MCSAHSAAAAISRVSSSSGSRAIASRKSAMLASRMGRVVALEGARPVARIADAAEERPEELPVAARARRATSEPPRPIGPEASSPPPAARARARHARALAPRSSRARSAPSTRSSSRPRRATARPPWPRRAHRRAIEAAAPEELQRRGEDPFARPPSAVGAPRAVRLGNPARPPLAWVGPEHRRDRAPARAQRPEEPLRQRRERAGAERVRPLAPLLERPEAHEERGRPRPHVPLVTHHDQLLPQPRDVAVASPRLRRAARQGKRIGTKDRCPAIQSRQRRHSAQVAS